MRKRYLSILIIFAITFLWPLFSKDFHVESERLVQMNPCLKDLQIPCRWVPQSSFGYGSPLFNFIPPLPYYLGSISFLVTKNLIFSTQIMYAIDFIFTLFFIWVFKKFINRLNITNTLLISISLFFLLTSNNLLSIILLLVLAAKVVLEYFKTNDKKIIIYSIISITLGILLSSFYLLPSIFEKNLINEIKVNGKLRDYLPNYSQDLPKEKTLEKFQVLTGESDIYDFTQGSNYFRFYTITTTHTIIRISQHYFPNWKIFIDGKEAQVDYKNNSLGLMTIILGKGEHNIEGRFFDTPIRIISNIITIASSVLILIIFLYQFKGIKKWVAYYKKGVGN